MSDQLKEDDSIFCLQDLSEILTRRGSLGYQVYPGTEREDYDFTAERVNLHGSNLVESTAHFIKGCLGAGILSMHVGFMYGGLWASLITSLVLGLLVFYTMTMLIRSAHKMYVRLRIAKLSYPDLAEVAVATGPWKSLRRFSKTIRYFVDFCLFVEMCGTCCIYEIMIASTIKKTMESISTTLKELDMHLRIYILIVTGPLIVLCLIRNLKYLAPLSMMADVVVGICVITTMYYSLTQGGSIHDRPVWKSFHGLIKFCGVFMYNIHGVAVIMPVENNMKKPKYFFIVLQYGMTVVLILTVSTGFFGYWGWGESCKSPITIHMPNETMPLILQFSLAMMLSVTFAIHFWVPFRVVWYYLGKRKRGVWERFYRLLHLIMIIGLSVAFPNLVRVMIFVGNFFLSFIAFIFPAIIESLVTWKEPRNGIIRWCLIKNVLLMAIGVSFCAGAFYSILDIN